MDCRTCACCTAQKNQRWNWLPRWMVAKSIRCQECGQVRSMPFWGRIDQQSEEPQPARKKFKVQRRRDVHSTSI